MVEYTYEQVMQALRAADAAGATEDARRLAQIAQSMSQPSTPAEPQGPTFRSVMGQINKGLASQGASNGQPTVVQTDQDRALIQKYSDPNYYRDNMLPSPE